METHKTSWNKSSMDFCHWQVNEKRKARFHFLMWPGTHPHPSVLPQTCMHVLWLQSVSGHGISWYLLQEMRGGVGMGNFFTLGTWLRRQHAISGASKPGQIKKYWTLLMDQALWGHIGGFLKKFSAFGKSTAFRGTETSKCESGVTKCYRRSSHCGSAVTNPTSIHKDVGSSPGLVQWIKDLVLLWAVV